MKTLTDAKAIALFAKDHNAKPQISAWPLYRFLMPDGTVEEHNIIHLRAELERQKKAKKNAPKELS